MAVRRRRTPRRASGGDDTLRRRAVEETTGFATAFLRWVDSTDSDGLSYPRLRVLEQLGCEGSAMMRVVAGRLGLSARNMTALVDSLEAEGLVMRRPHPADRRAVLLELTGKGRQASVACFERRVGAIGEVFDDLSMADSRKLLELLAKLREGIRRRGTRA